MIVTNERNYAIVEIAFDKGLCPDDCKYLRCESQRHPYGMGTATEEWTECDLLDEGSPDLDECPASKEASAIYAERNQ